MTATSDVHGEVSCEQLDAYWRAANYLSVGQIYLEHSESLRAPLAADHLKRRLLGHWGTTPGLNFVAAHVNRAVVVHGLDAFVVTGPGHGGPAALATAWLDGTLGERYDEATRDQVGMSWLFRQFSHPYGLPSHSGPKVPGSIHEGGELGYSLMHAVGAAFDDPDVTVACVIGDGEAETAALAASWQSSAFLHPLDDGVVVPILHLNDYKIANPTVLGRFDEARLRGFLDGLGWDPIEVDVRDCVATADGGATADRGATTDDATTHTAHRRMAGAIDEVLRRAQRRRERFAETGEHTDLPMIVLRSPKGWTGPHEIDGMAVEGTWRSHQVPIDGPGEDEDRRRALEAWLDSYRPTELFDEHGRPGRDVVGWLPSGDARLAANPRTTGGRQVPELAVPDIATHLVDVPVPAATSSSPTETAGRVLRDVIERDRSTRVFRLFGPDETASNRLDAVFEVADKVWNLPLADEDVALGPDGRVMEILSEHLCQGWLEGYLLTGRNGLFSTYEGFAPIVASMFNQHAKWLKESTELEWRRPIPSLNYLLSSHVWRQDHNGFSHQDTSFLDHVVNKPSPITRAYLPPDSNCLVHVLERCLSSRDLVNVMVAGKHPTPDWLSGTEARRHVDRGFGVWEWASTGHEHPDVTLVGIGDVPTVEVVAAASLLERMLPNLAVRVVNVVDLMALMRPDEHPSGRPDDEFDEVFPRGCPTIVAYHGYPALIHRLLHDRACRDDVHVRGFLEHGSTTTPFDMLVRNGVDRFSLLRDAVSHVARLGVARDAVVSLVERRHAEHLTHVRQHGDDLPEITDWDWGRAPWADR